MNRLVLIGRERIGGVTPISWNFEGEMRMYQHRLQVLYPDNRYDRAYRLDGRYRRPDDQARQTWVFPADDVIVLKRRGE